LLAGCWASGRRPRRRGSAMSGLASRVLSSVALPFCVALVCWAAGGVAAHGMRSRRIVPRPAGISLAGPYVPSPPAPSPNAGRGGAWRDTEHFPPRPALGEGAGGEGAHGPDFPGARGGLRGTGSAIMGHGSVPSVRVLRKIFPFVVLIAILGVIARVLIVIGGHAHWSPRHDVLLTRMLAVAFLISDVAI